MCAEKKGINVKTYCLWIAKSCIVQYSGLLCITVVIVQYVHSFIVQFNPDYLVVTFQYYGMQYRSVASKTAILYKIRTSFRQSDGSGAGSSLTGGGLTPGGGAWVDSRWWSMGWLQVLEHGLTPGGGTWVDSRFWSMGWLQVVERGLTPGCGAWVDSSISTISTISSWAWD